MEEEGVGVIRREEGEEEVAGEGLPIENLEVEEDGEVEEVEGEARVIRKVVEDGEVVSRVEDRGFFSCKRVSRSLYLPSFLFDARF